MKKTKEKLISLGYTWNTYGITYHKIIKRKYKKTYEITTLEYKELYDRIKEIL